MSKPRVLHKHRLGYFPELKVGEDIFTMRYASGCSMSNCHGICCADGVDVDIAERDRILVEYETRWPGYGFDEHKGYGTPAHRAALERLGPCPAHRRSFAPVQATLQGPDLFAECALAEPAVA